MLVILGPAVLPVNPVECVPNVMRPNAESKCKFPFQNWLNQTAVAADLKMFQEWAEKMRREAEASRVSNTSSLNEPTGNLNGTTLNYTAQNPSSKTSLNSSNVSTTTSDSSSRLWLDLFHYSHLFTEPGSPGLDPPTTTYYYTTHKIPGNNSVIGYHDKSHLNNVGAMYLLPFLCDKLVDMGAVKNKTGMVDMRAVKNKTGMVNMGAVKNKTGMVDVGVAVRNITGAAERGK